MSEHWAEDEDDAPLDRLERNVSIVLVLVVALIGVVAVLASSGCCTPQPPRLDPKKRAAFLDQTAVISSFAIWGGCPADLAQQHNADSEFMTRDGR